MQLDHFLPMWEVMGSNLLIQSGEENFRINYIGPKFIKQWLKFEHLEVKHGWKAMWFLVLLWLEHTPLQSVSLQTFIKIYRKKKKERKSLIEIAVLNHIYD